MNALTVRILNLKPRGRHVADPLAETAVACRACSQEDYGRCTCPADCGWLSCTGGWRDQPPVTAEAVAADLTARRALTAQSGIDTVTIPALAAEQAKPPAPPRRVLPDIYTDLRDLPGLRDAIRSTTQRGGTECGTCGRILPGATWAERFAAQLAHLDTGDDAAAAVTPLPDYDLRRYDGLASEVIAHALAVVDAEWAAMTEARDAEAASTEHAGRHAAGSEAAA